MKTLRRFAFLGLIALLAGMTVVACKKKDKDDDTSGGGGGGGGGGGSLVAAPASLTVDVTETKTTTISGGTAPYTIKSAPNIAFATANISGATLSVTGVAYGTTSCVVEDAAAATVQVNITCEDAGGQINWANGNFSCNIDTTPFTPSVVQGSLLNEVLSIAGVSGSQNVAASASSVTGPGSYVIDANKGVYTNGATAYSNTTPGTLTVTTMTSTSCQGTFSFDGTDGSTTVNITMGTFDLWP